MKDSITDYFGKTVRIKIDRPVGYVHHGYVYPLNYGYIPDTKAGDGEEQDVYLLGVAEPVEEYICTVMPLFTALITWKISWSPHLLG